MIRFAARPRAPFLTLLATATAIAALPPAARAQLPTGDTTTARLTERLAPILGRAEFRHAAWGIAFYSLDDDRTVFALNPQQLFTAASTTKLLTVGSALALLGPDHRFHTRVYRTGPVDTQGTLNGDLILVGAGDLNLSGRIQPGDTLGFTNEDHAYDADPNTAAVPGDPLLVIRQLAGQVAEHGIRRVTGRVLVDVSLFPEGQRELGMMD